MNFKYNPKVGFLLQNLTERSSGVYSCRASYNNSVNTAVYKLKILRKEILILLYNLLRY